MPSPQGPLTADDYFALRDDGRTELLDGEFVVEFLSPSNPENDLQRKSRLYLRHAVPEYWIGDTAGRTLRVLRNGGAGWVEKGVFGPGTALRPEGLPGVVVDLDEVYGSEVG